MRDDQTDTQKASEVAGFHTINFRPRDIRGDFYGIEDPKLEGEGGPEDAAGDDE